MNHPQDNLNIEGEIDEILTRWLEAARARGILDERSGRSYKKPLIGDLKGEAKQALIELVAKARVDELELLLRDWDMAEREPGDLRVHEYKDFETIRERIAELSSNKQGGKNE